MQLNEYKISNVLEKLKMPKIWWEKECKTWRKKFTVSQDNKSKEKAKKKPGRNLE